MNTNEKMAEMPMGKLLASMSFPLMVSLIVQSLYNIVDSIFVSRLSEDALTATGLAYPVQFLMIAISVGLAVGLNALMAKYAGMKENEKACHTAATGLILCLFTALLFALFGIFFSDTLASHLTTDAEIAELTGTYMKICVTFCGGIFLETLFQRMLTSVGFTALSMVSLVTGAVTNIILDPIMIFGYFGFPEMGIAGAAIATVIGQWVGACTAGLLNKTKNPIVHIHLKGFRFDFSEVKAVLKIGLPTMIMQAAGSVMVAAVNAILISTSSAAVAFFGVYYKLQGFVLMPMNGLGQALLPIAAYNLGAGKHDRVKKAWSLSVPAGIAFALCGTLLFMFFPASLLSLFSPTEEMLAIGVPAMRIIGVTFLPAAFTILAGYFAAGLGDGTVNMTGGLLRQVVVLIPVMYVLNRITSLPVLWFAFWVSEAAACLYCFHAIRKLMAKRGRIDAYDSSLSAKTADLIHQR